MSDPPTEPGTPAQGDSEKRRAIAARRYDEHLRLVAASLDRLSTLVLGGAVFAPIFQHAYPRWLETVGWIAVAVVLHLAAHFVLSLLFEED